MKPATTLNGAIDNSGAVQFDGLTLSCIPIIEPAPFDTAVQLAAGPTADAPPVAAAEQSSSGLTAASSATFASIVVHPIFGGGITNRVNSTADPTTAVQIENAIGAAINYIDTEFASSIPAIVNNGTISNSVTINIEFDHGNLNGQPLIPASGASRSQSNAYLFTYPQIKSSLPGAPAVDPTGGNLFYLPFAEMKALGFNGNTPITATSTEVDGYVGLNSIANGVTMDYNLNDQSVPGQINAVGAIEHEITEVFGRISILGTLTAQSKPIDTLMDLFRYSAPGIQALTAGPSDYFSLNGGTTDLAAYDNPANGGDPGDWAASMTNDAFDAFLIPGSPDTISAADSRQLAALGFTPVIAPVTIRGAVAKQLTNDTSSPRPFQTIVVSDPNPGQTDTVTVTLSTIANGTLSNPGGGSYNTTTGVWTDSGTSDAITAALNGLVFTPNAHQVPPSQSVTTTFTIADGDTAGASASDATTSVIALALGVVPAITGATAGQTSTDQMPVTPFPRVALADVNAGQTETVTVTLSAAANGTLAGAGGGAYHASTGVWTDTGAVVSAMAALDGLVFTPTPHQFPAGQTVTTTFTITLTDTAGLSATNNTANLITAETGPNGAGLLDGVTVSQQLELIYIAYFDRAADGGGFAFWGGQSLHAEALGQSVATALTNVANAFTPQPETIALYPFLASQNLTLSSPEAQIGLGNFIDSVYGNLFGRTVDASGKAYWVSQITNGLVGPGAAALAIANGAAGSDAVELLNKIAVAFDFTSKTNAAGVGVTAPLPGSFIATAKTVLTGVDGTSLNDASVTSAMNTTVAWLASPVIPVLGAGYPAGAFVDPNVMTVAGQDQLIDPGPGSHTIRFLPGASGDTLVPHADGIDQVSGFDPVTDFLNLRSLLVAAQLNPDIAASGDYFPVLQQGGDAVLRFDPSGLGSGATVAVLWGLGDGIAALRALVTAAAGQN